MIQPGVTKIKSASQRKGIKYLQEYSCTGHYRENSPLSTDHKPSITVSFLTSYHQQNYIIIFENDFTIVTSPPIGGGRGIVMPVSVCFCVCVCVCLFVCPCFRKISKCNISAISQPIIMKLGHTYYVWVHHD